MSFSSQLPLDLEQCHQILLQMQQTLAEQAQHIKQLQQQIQQLRQRLYGKKSERHDPNQLLLFEVEELQSEVEPEPPISSTESSRRRSRHAHGRDRIPDHWPRQRIVHELAGEELACPCCGQPREKISEVVSEQWDYQPASFCVIENVRFTYACRGCEEHLVTAAKPPQAIEKGLAGPGLLATLIVNKYSDHLPLYRLEEIFSREGVFFSRSTTCSWMAACAERLRPLYDLLQDQILQSRVIHTDDTPVKMRLLGSGMQTSRMWIYVGDTQHPYTVFDSTTTRCREGPLTFLEGFEGYLQSDAYTGYHPLYDRGVIYVGCWAHARRKFHEVKTSDPLPAHEALGRIGQLYALEEKMRDCTEEEKAQRRQEEAVPLLASFRRWLLEQQGSVLPRSGLGRAIAYALNNWAGLCRYTEAGFLSVDNNVSERGLRPLAVGRNNWLFLGSERGGQTAAVLLSLIASCKQNGVDPFAYLRDVLQRLPIHPPEQLADFFPDRWLSEHPEAIWIRRADRASRRSAS